MRDMLKDDRIVYVQNEKNIGLAANFQYGWSNATRFFPFYRMTMLRQICMPMRSPSLNGTLGDVCYPVSDGGDTGQVWVFPPQIGARFYPYGEGLMTMAKYGAQSGLA
jgi:hypothetical protein